MSLIDYLDIKEEHSVIAVVGAGGKTSIVFALAKAFNNMGQRVCITTTTKMFAVEDDYYYTQRGKVFKQDIRKITALDEADYHALREEFDIVLVEADGARMLPMKAPASHEPVIPSDAKLVIGILGARSIGKAIKETCYNPEIAAEILGKSIDDIVTLEDLKILLNSDLSQKKGVNTDYRNVIGQADLLKERVEDNLGNKCYYFSRELYKQ